MACHTPLQGWLSHSKNPSTGRRSVTFEFKEAWNDVPQYVACKQCIGCRLKRSREWAIRCCHEASLYSDNCFITLTYSPENCPKNGLQKKHVQKFMKRLRKRYGNGIRYFYCGEYGEKFSRPHYHMCLFNFDFPDKKFFKNRNSHPVYRSDSLEQLWPYGFSEITDLTFETAAYAARYITKKITGACAPNYYEKRQPEYCDMSRRPGLATGWYKQFTSDVYPDDMVVIREKVFKPPGFYDRKFEIDYPEDFEKLKLKRKEESTSSMYFINEQELAAKDLITKTRLQKHAGRRYETYGE